MRCGRHFTLSEQEAEKFHDFFKEQGLPPQPKAFGICPNCWGDLPPPEP